MTLEIRSQEFDKVKKDSIFKFSEEQLEILQDEYEKKCANDYLETIRESELVEHYRTKYRISKRDVLDMLLRDGQNPNLF